MNVGKFIGNVPLLVIPFGLYNVFAFSGDYKTRFSAGVADFFALSNLIVFLSIALLFIEIYKATRTGQSSILDHVFSMLLFVGGEFVYIHGLSYGY